jgi:hypothetical protein
LLIKSVCMHEQLCPPIISVCLTTADVAFLGSESSELLLHTHSLTIISSSYHHDIHKSKYGFLFCQLCKSVLISFEKESALSTQQQRVMQSVQQTTPLITS